MAREAVTITVPWDPARLGANRTRRMLWQERARLTQVAREAAFCAWRAAGRPVIDGKVEVSLLVRRGRVLDPDNALAGCKAVLDQLLCRRRNGAGVVEDDSAAFVDYVSVRFETGARWRLRPEVVVTISPVEAK